MFDAIRHALGWLSFDELPRDERPPRNIWTDPKRLSEHFKAVERRREEKYGGSQDGVSDKIDGPVVQNDTEALLGIRRGR